MISRVACVLIFFTVLLGSGTLLSEIDPFATVPGVREKFDRFAAHAGEYDTLFIGSSRINHGIDPAVFDELTAGAGVPTHSFNFGVDAMMAPENAYLFEHLAVLPPGHLRWVFIESSAMISGVGFGGPGSVRSVHWHDSARTAAMVRAVLAPPARPGPWSRMLFGTDQERRPLQNAFTHLRLWLLRTLNAGRGASLLGSWLAPATHWQTSAVTGPLQNGYVVSRASISAGDRVEYERCLAAGLATPAPVSFLDRDAQNNLDGMLTRIRALGARAILLIPPYLAAERLYPQPAGALPVLDYAEIGKWPALFQVDHRLDHSHVNAEGADLFTRAVAADFIQLANSQR